MIVSKEDSTKSCPTPLIPWSKKKKKLLRFSAHFLIGLFVFLVLSIRLYFGYFGYPYWIHDLQLFSPIQWVAFSFCWWFPLLCRRFSVWCSPTYLFLLLLLKSDSKTIIAKTCIKELTACNFFYEFYQSRSYAQFILS